MCKYFEDDFSGHPLVVFTGTQFIILHFALSTRGCLPTVMPWEMSSHYWCSAADYIFTLTHWLTMASALHENYCTIHASSCSIMRMAAMRCCDHFRICLFVAMMMCVQQCVAMVRMTRRMRSIRWVYNQGRFRNKFLKNICFIHVFQ